MIRPDKYPEWLQCLLLIVLMVAAKVALTPFNHINNDVAFLAWAAKQVLGTAVYGRDILDVNPPLAFMLYVPAALIAPWTGFDPAVRLTMMLLSALSIAAFWQSADRTMRLPLSIVLGLFFVFAFPDHFAQREQIAFLLCAPYVAGIGTRRGWATVIGLMAGVGFMIKPHFLIPLAMLAAYRRRIGTEEIAIAAAGAVYALALAVFFRPYLLEMVPAASLTYWAVAHDSLNLILPALTIFGSVLSLFVAGARQASAMPYLLATLGFTAAALLQNKGFDYHFIPAWGFLALYITAMCFNPRRFVARVARLFLLAEAVMLCGMIYRVHFESQRLRNLLVEVRREIENSDSFASLVPHPYPGFPATFYAKSRFQGIAIMQLFIPAVAYYETSGATGDSATVKRLALDQAKRELAGKPELVFAWTDYESINGKTFDIIAWLNQDEGFRAMWKDYVHTRTIGGYLVFRRK